MAVAEESHFGRAAERLGIAQPPLSQRIKRLERELGVRLFERTSRQVAITKAGTLLLADTRELLVRSEDLLATARRIRDGDSGLLRAALPPDIAGDTLAAILGDFQQRHVGVELELRELTTTQQLAQLASHDLDVGLIHHPCDVSGLTLGPVLHREVGVLLPRDAPAAALDEVPLSALTGYGLILFHRADAPALHDDVLTTCARNGYTPAGVRHGQGVSFVRGLILSANAVAFSPRDAHLAPAGDQDPDITWRPLVGNPLAWRLSVAWPQGRGDTAVSTFAEAATRALRSTAAASPDPTPRHLRPAAEYWL
ncbi:MULTISPECIES: LysR family transcriptional regulator [unclassified Streptomyces]|uniref:LysR family transcriptional regulator n=1 Tax=unclassified Streptomyces TaxID=2593676 RepID=UPI00224CBB74|nr:MULTISPECIES: LysR substrate-binding domain-containing protein [unclassified Streptomyces]MCX5123734.1 LysR substrate-binding domain-containing protein [Streptomyces sp. NBC_00347]WUD82594.1 LysR substrate-binding domain-containing protein [Streptomyces sp. NBC_00503]